MQRIKIKDLGDLPKAYEMIELADKLDNDGMIPFKNEKGEVSSLNHNRYLKMVEEDVDSFLKDNGVVYDSKTLAGNIKKLVEQNHMRISWLEDALKLSTGYISRTTGKDPKRRLSIDVVSKIATLFGMTIDTLVNLDMTGVTPDIKPIVDYIEKLCEQTEKCELKWDIPPFFGDTHDIIQHYQNMLSEHSLVYDSTSTYITEYNGEEMLFSTINTDEGISYILCAGAWSMVVDSYQYNFIPICFTKDEKSGVLTKYGEKLKSIIISHKEDYKVSDDVNKYIASYLEQFSKERG